ncbi:MAG: PTS sugar transporter subunit IIA [Chlamydiia bacterium]|nr:PTS sugar transporter subunit IIA [Chlamydiia bacterium]
MDLTHYTSDQLISFFDTKDQKQALRHLISMVKGAGKIKNEADFLEKVEAREAITSTGIGMGVALPHAKDKELENFFICIGVSEHGIEWHSIDGNPVKLIFLIGGPDYKQNEYLNILSSLTTMIKDEEKRKKMLTVNSPVSMMKLLN